MTQKATTTTTASTGTFAVDKTHSEVAFQVRHLVTRVRGHFTDFSGTLQFDEARPEQSSLTLTINAASIETGASDRDGHLRGDDFFSVEKFPTITFTTSAVIARGAGRFDIEGTLTIRGTAKTLTVPVTYLGTATDPWGNARVGFEGEVAINRKDFGLNWNAALETGGFLVGDEVKISVSLQAIQQ
jgi:polyisoprenoid-binding protein YceI